MKAMQLFHTAPVESEPLVWSDVPEPEPADGEIRVSIRACGVCRTDLHVVEGDLPEYRMPIIPGHEVVGVVDRLGAGVSRELQPGMRVGIAWLRSTCGHCFYCRNGMENLCGKQRFTGYHENGGYAEYAVVPAAWAYRIPDVFVDAEAAPLLCAGIIGFRALRRSRIRPGERLALFGYGSSAFMALQVARYRGCTVDIYTRSALHRNQAAQAGAAWTGSIGDRSPHEADAAIVFAPAGEIIPIALQRVRKGGTVAMAGIYMTPIPELDYEKTLFYERDLRSVTANTRRDGEDFLKIAAEIPIKPVVEMFPLRKANEALLKLKKSALHGTAVLLPGL